MATAYVLRHESRYVAEYHTDTANLSEAKTFPSRADAKDYFHERWMGHPDIVEVEVKITLKPTHRRML